MNSHQRRKRARAQGYTLKRQIAIVTAARLAGVIRNPQKVQQLMQQLHHVRVQVLKSFTEQLGEQK